MVRCSCNVNIINSYVWHLIQCWHLQSNYVIKYEIKDLRHNSPSGRITLQLSKVLKKSNQQINAGNNLVTVCYCVPSSKSIQVSHKFGTGLL